MSLINKKNIFGFPRTFLEISLNDRVHHSAHTSHHSAHTPTHHTPIHTYLYTHTLTHRVYLLIMTHKHKNGSSPRLTSVAWLRLPQSCGTYGGIPTLPPATAPQPWPRAVSHARVNRVLLLLHRVLRSSRPASANIGAPGPGHPQTGLPTPATCHPGARSPPSARVARCHRHHFRASP